MRDRKLLKWEWKKGELRAVELVEIIVRIYYIEKKHFLWKDKLIKVKNSRKDHVLNTQVDILRPMFLLNPKTSNDLVQLGQLEAELWVTPSLKTIRKEMWRKRQDTEEVILKRL